MLYVLAHDDETLFANWNKKIGAYAMYFTEQTSPPSPESLEIVNESGEDKDVSSMRWLPVSTLQTYKLMTTEHVSCA